MVLADLGQLVGRAVSVRALAPDPGALAELDEASGVDLDDSVPVTPDLLASAGAVAEDAVPAVIVGRAGTLLSLVSEDHRLAGFHAHRVRIDAGMGEEVFRVEGVVRVSAPDDELVTAGFVPRGEPEHLQRREWIRVRTAVVARIVGPGGAGEVTTVDLSGGGARVTGPDAIAAGSKVRIELALDRGPVDLEARVLGPGPDGSVRLLFVDVPEGKRARIIRHVYAVQLDARRALQSLAASGTAPPESRFGT